MPEDHSPQPAPDPGLAALYLSRSEPHPGGRQRRPALARNGRHRRDQDRLAIRAELSAVARPALQAGKHPRALTREQIPPHKLKIGKEMQKPHTVAGLGALAVAV
jgi:hypothetical protein